MVSCVGPREKEVSDLKEKVKEVRDGVSQLQQERTELISKVRYGWT